MTDAGRRWWTAPWQAILNFRKDNALDLAAGIAFYSLLSLGPLLYVLGAALSRVYAGREGVPPLVGQLSTFLPAEAMTALERISADLQSGDGVVLLAVPALLWIATTVFSALEHAVNVAFGLARFRSVWRARLKAVALLAVGCLLLLGESIFGNFLPHLERLRQALDLPVSRSSFSEISYHSGLTILRLLVFTLFYKILPRARVSWRAAAGGALLGVVLLQLARVGFGRMLVNSPTLGLLTGALAGTVTLLMWVYASAAITLLAAEYAAVLDGRRVESPQLEAAGRPPRK